MFRRLLNCAGYYCCCPFVAVLYICIVVCILISFPSQLSSFRSPIILAPAFSRRISGSKAIRISIRSGRWCTERSTRIYCSSRPRLVLVSPLSDQISSNAQRSCLTLRTSSCRVICIHTFEFASDCVKQRQSGCFGKCAKQSRRATTRGSSCATSSCGSSYLPTKKSEYL